MKTKVGIVYTLMNDSNEPFVASLSEEDMLDSFISFMDKKLNFEVKREDLTIKYNSYYDGGVILIEDEIIQRFVIVKLHTK